MDDPKIPAVRPTGQLSPLSIGSPIRPGLAKLAEEAGELIQVIGKIAAYPEDVEHPDGTNLNDRLVEEMGDVLGAMEYIMLFGAVDKYAVIERARLKRQRFSDWHMEINS